MTAKNAEQATAKKAPAKPAGYTDKQLAAGKAARGAGASWTKVAEAAGVKAENHFSRVLRDRFPELTAPVEKPAKAKQAPPAPAAKGKTATRRTTKKAPAAA